MFMTYLFDFTCFATVVFNVLEVMALYISLKQLVRVILLIVVVILLIGPKVLLCVMNYSPLQIDFCRSEQCVLEVANVPIL